MAHCHVVQTPEGAALVCGSRRHNTRDVKPCFVKDCPGNADKLCDYPVAEGKTCDRPCCLRHSRPVKGKEDTDYCLEHAFKKESSGAERS
jgi:hypothetical protein